MQEAAKQLSYHLHYFFSKMITYWSWWWEVNNEGDELARTILTISVPALLFLWYKYWMLFLKDTTSLPPGPYGLPVVGYLPFLGSNLHERFTEMAHKYGPIFSLRLGSKLHVVVNSMDLVKVVAHNMDQTFANRSPKLTALTFSYGGLDIIFSNNNTHWRNMRKLLGSRLLSKDNLEACQSFRTYEVKRMVNKVYTKIGEEININEIAFNTIIDVVTSMLWGRSKLGEGKDSSNLGKEFREIEFKIVELLAASNISDFFPMLMRFDLQKRQRDMKRLVGYVDRILDNIIEERIKVNSSTINGPLEEDGRTDFLQILLELKDQKDTSTPFKSIHIKALFMDIILAATDSASTMVEWVMAEIFNNQSEMRKVQDELSEVIGMKNTVKESHLPKLRYLDAVIKETFRLHPSLPLLLHRCPDKSCIVGGYTIPKGSIVFMNIGAIQRDPKNWTNPLEFKPERFLNGSWDYNGNNLKFLPFGSGRRICAGISLGEKMLMYILASLLHSFDWMLPKDEKLELSDIFGIVARKRKPLIAIPSQRLSNSSFYM